MEWFLKVVRDNYANFNGRARRKEYWMFFLFNVIIGAILNVLDRIFGLSLVDDNAYGGGGGILGTIFSLALFIPSLAVGVRRLHDTGKSGWNLLWALTCIGVIYVIYLYIIEGDKGQNEYGPDPKQEENQDPFAGQRPAGNTDSFSNPVNPPIPPFNKDSNL